MWSRRFLHFLLWDVLLLTATFGLFVLHCNSELPKEALRNDWNYVNGTEVDFIREGYHYKSFTYLVRLENGEEYRFPLYEFYNYVLPLFILLILFQCFDLINGVSDTKRIRKKLRPLNELAVKAEAMGNISYEHLEHAISSASPESPKIVTGDRELQSIEIALNSLLTKMQESRQQQVRFVSDASHELRTPIAVIQGYVNMLDRWGKEDPEVLEESITALKNESEHMKELIEQLLFLARGDSGRNTLNRTNFDLGDVLREVWEESLMIDETHTYVLKGISEDPSDYSERFIINGDLAMVKQSIRIFVQNAAKYSEEGSTIKLGVQKENGKVLYTIQDEGIGMTGQDISHIFERFFRSDEVRNENTGGSGLGLSIAKWIIDAHDGTINVLSRQDVGTRFTVSFQEVQ
jgi:signal transduction histidine kinase